MCDNKCDITPIKNNNISSKMLRAKMITNRKQISYNNSNKSTVLDIIKKNIFSECKKLLLEIGLSTYKKHLNALVDSCSNRGLEDLDHTLQSILVSLNLSELKFLGLYDPTDEELLIEQMLYNNSFLNNYERMYYCVIITVGDTKKIHIKNYKKDLFEPSKTYLFNLEHSSNTGHSLSLSSKIFTYKDVNFTYLIGTPGTSGSYLVYIPSKYISTSSVYLFDKNNKTKYSYITFSEYLTKIYLNITNTNYSTNNKTYNTIYKLVRSSKLHRTQQYSNLHYMFSDLNTYNYAPANKNWNYSERRVYGLNYGVYHINSSKYITILNKNKETSIKIYGDVSANDTLVNLTKNGELDDTYTFYTGNVYIKVVAPFGECSIYLKDEGYCNLYDCLIFDETNILDIDETNIYEEISLNNIQCLYPESRIYFHDISNNIVSKDGEFTSADISSNPFVTLNNNIQDEDIEYVSAVDTSIDISYSVTVNTKTTNHPYYDIGSSNGYYLDGTESPYLNLSVNRTYRFNQEDSTNDGHPLLFFEDISKNTEYTTDVNINGTPGNSGAYSEITITTSTPQTLYYQCGNHEYMGGVINIDTSDISYSVTVDNSTGSNLYYLDNVKTPTLTVTVGTKYIFYQEDSTNDGHPLLFFEDINKNTQYTTDVNIYGTPGNSGAYSEITITSSTPATLYYQCSNHNYMGGVINIQVNYNDSNTLKSHLISYGLYKGKYIIKNIPSNRYIAFINKNKEDCFVYYGNSQNIKKRIGPDNNVYNFYTDYVVIEVYGNFGYMSFYEFYNGYCGGKNILIYDDTICSDISNEFQDWYEYVNNESKFNSDCSNIIIDDYDVSFLSISKLNSYINVDISTNYENTSITSIYFDNITDVNTKYSLNKGIYQLMDVSINTPIAILNKDKEEFISYDGYFPYKTGGLGPDGNYYDFYYGNINIYVYGDFGLVSIFIGGSIGKYLNGRNKLIYDNSSINTGNALPVYNSISSYPITEEDLEEDTPQTFYIAINVDFIYINRYTPIPNSVTLHGYDRNGQIDGNASFPDLTFKLGDIVVFNYHYNNSTFPFGIYINGLPVKSNITNNKNNSNYNIEWIPIYVGNNYYYKLDTLIPYEIGNITIINNENADIIIPDITSFEIYNNSQIEIIGNELTTDINNIKIYFDQDIFINDDGGTYYLYIKDIINDTIFKQVLNNDSTITVTNNIITYTPNFGNNERLDFDSSYNISIDEHFIRNIYYNGLNETIADSSLVCVFHTEDAHRPILTSIDPPINTLLDKDNIITLTFSEDISININRSEAITDITYTNSDDNTVILYPNVEISNNKLLIYNTNIEYGQTYDVSIPSDYIVDLSNIIFEDSDNLLDSYQIESIEDPRPQLYYSYPNHLQTNVYVNSSINLIFNENVYTDTSYNSVTNYINIRDNSTNTIFDIIDVSDEYSQITGQGTNTIKITPYIDLSNSTDYTYEINSTTIKNISNNYYVGISYDDISFSVIDDTTNFILDTSSIILDSSSSVNIVNVNSENKYTFNGDTIYNNIQYIFDSSGLYTLTNVSSDHPIAILNNEISNNIIYYPVDNSNIVINVNDKTFNGNTDTEEDYFNFTDENDNAINLTVTTSSSSIFRLMRGRSYKFVNKITTDPSFILYYSDTSDTFIESDSSFVVKIPSDHDVSLGTIYYRYKDSNYDLSHNIDIYYKTINETNELGNGNYDFYYGNVDISINNPFGSVSVYCYNHGYMGGKYKLLYI